MLQLGYVERLWDSCDEKVVAADAADILDSISESTAHWQAALGTKVKTRRRYLLKVGPANEAPTAHPVQPTHACTDQHLLFWGWLSPAGPGRNWGRLSKAACELVMHGTSRQLGLGKLAISRPGTT